MTQSCFHKLRDQLFCEVLKNCLFINDRSNLSNQEKQWTNLYSWAGQGYSRDTGTTGTWNNLVFPSFAFVPFCLFHFLRLSYSICLGSQAPVTRISRITYHYLREGKNSDTLHFVVPFPELTFMAGVGEQDYIAQIGQWGPPFVCQGHFQSQGAEGKMKEVIHIPKNIQ